MPVHAELTLVGVARGTDDHARRQVDQGLEASSVERQVLGKIAVDHRAHRRRLGVEQSRAPLDGQGLRIRSHRQGEIDGQGSLHVEHNVRLDQRLESDFCNLQAIGAGREIGDDVDAFLIGSARVEHAGSVVYDEHRGPRNSSAGGIEHQSVDDPAGGLRRQGSGGEHNQRETEMKAHAASPRGGNSRPAFPLYPAMPQY